jgi:hypothetical protein
MRGPVNHEERRVSAEYTVTVSQGGLIQGLFALLTMSFFRA